MVAKVRTCSKALGVGEKDIETMVPWFGMSHLFAWEQIWEVPDDHRVNLQTILQTLDQWDPNHKFQQSLVGRSG